MAVEEYGKDPPVPRLGEGLYQKNTSQCLQKCKMREGIPGGGLPIAISKYLLSK